MKRFDDRQAGTAAKDDGEQQGAADHTEPADQRRSGPEEPPQTWHAANQV